MRRELLSTARPSPLRLATFLATAGGGALLGLGPSLAWGRTRLLGFDPVDVRGLDLWEGRIALAAGVLVLLSVPAGRLAGRRGRIAWGAVVLATGLLAAAVAVAHLAAGEERLGGPSADRVARELAEETGLPEDALRRRLEEVPVEVERGPGTAVTLAGAALAAVGGALTVAWARRGPEPAAPGTAD